MPGDLENNDRREARTMAVVLGAMVLAGVAITIMAWPALVEFHDTWLAPGIGLRDAALISFAVTFLTLVVFALAAGDGLLGEIQFMLLSFFGFFAILWLLIAWIF
ncbi:MAG: hypothetical protein WEB57_08760 [Pseudohongiellaceae bacterium]